MAASCQPVGFAFGASDAIDPTTLRRHRCHPLGEFHRLAHLHHLVPRARLPEILRARHGRRLPAAEAAEAATGTTAGQVAPDSRAWPRTVVNPSVNVITAVRPSCAN